MKNLKILSLLLFSALIFPSCSNDDEMTNPPVVVEPDFSGTYNLADQMGRPAINTVFIPSNQKDEYNQTIPSDQGAAYAGTIEAGLKALSPAYANDGDQNALGLDAAAFAGVLATDVLTVTLDGTTTFYDGTNVLTGRNLTDDVITVELLLIFGGEDFSENPNLSDDHVDANDKAFNSSFPYLASPW